MHKEQILYEDKDIIVCYKPVGVATQTAKIGQADMVSEVANYLARAAKNSVTNPGSGEKVGQPIGGNPYVGVVHRLDQPVEGILVFAKNPKAAGLLSRQINENQTEKYYYAVACDGRESGETDIADKGTLVDYLYKDGKSNTTSVVSKEHKGAKRAELFYEVREQMAVKELLDAPDMAEQELLLVKIKLVTGRHHQIRVQMSHAGMGLLGDYKYADEQVKKLSELLQQKQVALCACELAFRHPRTGEKLWFQKMPESAIFQKFAL